MFTDGEGPEHTTLDGDSFRAMQMDPYMLPWHHKKDGIWGVQIEVTENAERVCYNAIFAINATPEEMDGVAQELRSAHRSMRGDHFWKHRAVDIGACRYGGGAYIAVDGC